MLKQLRKLRNPCVQRFLRKNAAVFGLLPLGLLAMSIQEMQWYSRFLLILSYQYLFSRGQIKKP